MCPPALLGLGSPVSPGCVELVGAPPSPACPSFSSPVLMCVAPLCSLPAFGREDLAFPFLLERAWLLEEGSFDWHKHVLPLRSPDACSITGCSPLFFISKHVPLLRCCVGVVPGIPDLDQIYCASASCMEGLMHGDSSGAPCKSSSARNCQHVAEGSAFLQLRHRRRFVGIPAAAPGGMCVGLPAGSGSAGLWGCMWRFRGDVEMLLLTIAGFLRETKA